MNRFSVEVTFSHPFPTGKHLSQSGRVVAGRVPWLLPAR